MCKIIVLLLAICLTTSVAEQERIAGGAIATLAQHPYTAAVLFAANTVNFQQTCGGAIINNRSMLSAIYCWIGSSNNHPNNFRVRVGSVNSSASGSLHNVAQLISHPNYNSWNLDNNIGILRVATRITFGTIVRPVPIAGPNYNLADYQYVWAIGWGRMTVSGVHSEQLRRVELRTVNQGRCQDIYGVGFVTPNMLCAGWQVAGRGSCVGDTGSPLIHNNVAVGVTSLGIGCGDVNFPSIYMRISRYSNWIQNNVMLCDLAVEGYTPVYPGPLIRPQCSLLPERSKSKSSIRIGFNQWSLAVVPFSSFALALPQQRIAGGSLTSIAQHPYAAVFLYARDSVNYVYHCGGTIINNRSVLTAALCWGFRPAHQIRIRVGSSYANSGGSLHRVGLLIEHPNLDDRTEDSNIGIVRVTTAFTFDNNVRAAFIAGPNYTVLENQYVMAIGWGEKGEGGILSEQLRQAQIRKVSQSVCRRYHVSRYISPNMLCAGWDGGRGSCWSDHGSPLLHNNIVVGITSFGTGCGASEYPSIYTRVSRFTSWISSNA